MCQRITCKSCGKPSYAGCGRHIEAVLGDVAPEARCRCREAGAKEQPTAKRSSWLASMFTRSGGRRA
jgi:hypothetical protein